MDDDDNINIWVACSDGDLSRVKQLLLEGCDVNAQDDSGYSPIHASVSYNHLDLVKFLLEQGASLKLQDEDGDFPLHVCETIPMFDLLVAAGADPMTVNFLGESLHKRLMDDHNDELLSHLMNHLVRAGLGSEMGVTVTAYSKNDDDDEEDMVERNEAEDDEDDDE